VRSHSSIERSRAVLARRNPPPKAVPVTPAAWPSKTSHHVANRVPRCLRAP